MTKFWKVLENVGPSGMFITLPDTYATKEAAVAAARAMLGTFRVQAFTTGQRHGATVMPGEWENVPPDMDAYRKVAAALVADLDAKHPELREREAAAMRRYAAKLIHKEGRAE